MCGTGPSLWNVPKYVYWFMNYTNEVALIAYFYALFFAYDFTAKGKIYTFFEPVIPDVLLIRIPFGFIVGSVVGTYLFTFVTLVKDYIGSKITPNVRIVDPFSDNST